MRGAVLAALAVCAAEGAVAQVPLKGTAGGNYSTPQDWVIPCIPGLFVSAYVSTPTPLTLGGLPFGAPGGRSVACNTSQQMVLSFRPDPQAEGMAQRVEASWVIEAPTAEPATSTATDVPPGTYTPLTVTLVADGAPPGTAGTDTPLTPVQQTSAPPTDAPVMYPPLTSTPGTQAPLTPMPPTPSPPTNVPPTEAPPTPAPSTAAPPTSAPDTYVPLTPRPPTPISVTVHHVSDRGAFQGRCSTPQEWIIACTPYSTLWMDIQYTPSGDSLTVDGKSIYSWSKDQRVYCPSSGRMSVLYTPSDGWSQTLRIGWSPETPETPAPPTPSPAATVHYMSNHGSVYSTYFSTPQKWVISCTPYSTLVMDIQSFPAGYSLELGDKTMFYGSNQRVTCPYSGQLSLLYTSNDDGWGHTLKFSWSIPETQAPRPPTVHHMSNHGSIYNTYTNPQEWIISCTRYSTLWMDIQNYPSGYNLTLDGRSLSYDRHVSCPDSGKVSLLYTRSDGHNHTVRLQWYPGTAAPTWVPATQAPPAPSPMVHYMSDHGSISSSYRTSQEWIISCTRYSTLWVDIQNSPSGYNLTLDGRSLSYDRHVSCPYSGKVSLLYTPSDGWSHTVRLQWYPGTAAPTWVPATQAPPTPSPLTVHYMSDHGSISSSYRTSQEWIITCTRNSTLWVDIAFSSSSYTLTFNGKTMCTGFNQRVYCPSSGKASLLYTPHDSWSNTVKVSWNTEGPETPATPTPSPLTVHHMSDYGSIYTTYSTPQEWIISCTRYSTLWMDIRNYPSGYNLTLDGRSLSYDRHVSCPDSGKVSLMYTPSDGHNHTVRLQWYPGTAAPTWVPATQAPPTPSPLTVHHMSDYGSIYTTYPTPQEWVISCTRNSTLVMDIQYSPSGYSLKLDGRSLYYGYGQRVTCPYSEKMSLLYTPHDADSHALKLKWSIAPAPRTPSPASVHYMSQEDSVHSSYSSAQEWLISCTPYRYVDVAVTQVAGTLTASTTTLYPGQRSVHCPSTGQMKLSYTPYSDSSQPLIVRWAPEGQAHTSKSLSPLLFVVTAAAGVLALVGVTVAVYCGCRGQAAERKAYSSNVQCEGYAGVGPTGVFGVHDSCTSPEGKQPMSEMEEHLLPVDNSPVM